MWVSRLASDNLTTFVQTVVYLHDKNTAIFTTHSYHYTKIIQHSHKETCRTISLRNEHYKGQRNLACIRPAQEGPIQEQLHFSFILPLFPNLLDIVPLSQHTLSQCDLMGTRARERASTCNQNTREREERCCIPPRELTMTSRLPNGAVTSHPFHVILSFGPGFSQFHVAPR